MKKTTKPTGDHDARNHKDTLFCALFDSKKELLALYNAIRGTHYSDPDELQITTLPDATYMKMKNDVSFLLRTDLSMYEHQSSVCGNLCLRFLLYVARVFKRLIRTRDLYSTKRIPLPAPNFVTFYNGRTVQPEKATFHLSDAFEALDGLPNLELTVIQLNINPGYNEDLKEKCPTLLQYTLYVEKVREHTSHMPVSEAVQLAMEECIKEDILADFFRENREKVYEMSLFEFNEELHDQNLYDEGREEGYISGHKEGYASGREDGILALIEALGENGFDEQYILDKAMQKFHLDEQTAREYLQRVVKRISLC